MDQKIKAGINLLGLLMLIALFVLFIKHVDKLTECVIKEENNTITYTGLYGDAPSCHKIGERLGLFVTPTNFPEPNYKIIKWSDRETLTINQTEWTQ